MYNVYTYVYNNKRVCTCYIHFKIFMYMSVHVHDFMNMHKHVQTCLYPVQTCMYSFAHFQPVSKANRK